MRAEEIIKVYNKGKHNGVVEGLAIATLGYVALGVVLLKTKKSEEDKTDEEEK